MQTSGNPLLKTKGFGIAHALKLRKSGYVCRSAPQRARSDCPVKSIAARRIEESVVAQVRSALAADDTRAQLNVTDSDWLALSQNESGEFLRRIIRRVVYHGATAAVSLELGHED